MTRFTYDMIHSYGSQNIVLNKGTALYIQLTTYWLFSPLMIFYYMYIEIIEIQGNILMKYIYVGHNYQSYIHLKDNSVGRIFRAIFI